MAIEDTSGGQRGVPGEWHGDGAAGHLSLVKRRRQLRKDKPREACRAAQASARARGTGTARPARASLTSPVKHTRFRFSGGS